MKTRKRIKSIWLLSALVGVIALSTNLVSNAAAGIYNPEIFAIQKKIKELGYNPGPLDGIFGVSTSEALKKYQKRNELPVTGILDFKTSDLLGVKISIKTISETKNYPWTTYYQNRLANSIASELLGRKTASFNESEDYKKTDVNPSDISGESNFSTPIVMIASPSNGDTVFDKEAYMQVVVKDKSSLKKIEMFVNGKPVPSPDQRAIIRQDDTGGKVSRTFKATLDPGENTIIVRAHNHYAFGEDRVTLYREKKADETVLLPRLFILAVGASDYQHLGANNKLNYTTADAHAFAAMFKPMKGKLFSEVYTKVLAAGGDLKPTADNIQDNLNFFAQASQHDVAMLFLAGHGIRDNTGRYYFLPEDAKQDDQGNFRRSTMIKWSDIKESLDIPATMLAFMDTCHSGSLFKSGKVRAVDNNRIIRELLEQGTVVFASSTGSEFSIENSQWGHGAFTYAILQGLQKGGANLIKDNRITWKELDTFVSNMVVELTNGAQHPVSYAPDGPKDFVLWLVGN